MIQVEKLVQVAAHTGSVYSIISDGSETIFTAGSDGIVIRWNIHQPESPTAVAKIAGQIFTMYLFQPLNQLWIGTMSGAVHVIDLNLKKEIHHFVNHSASVFDIQLSNDGKIFIASKDGSISIWEPTTAQFIQSIHITDSSLRKNAFHPTRNEMAIGSSDNCIYILTTDNYQLATKIESHSNSVFSLCYSSDGNELYSGGRDALLHSYDVLNQYFELRKLPAHLYTINDIVLLDNNLMATASRDKNIKIWSEENLE
ncbi:MAG: hypothetical protein WCI97_08745, partial [Bacteroidota bacterium]